MPLILKILSAILSLCIILKISFFPEYIYPYTLLVDIILLLTFSYSYLSFLLSFEHKKIKDESLLSNSIFTKNIGYSASLLATVWSLFSVYILEIELSLWLHIAILLLFFSWSFFLFHIDKKNNIIANLSNKVNENTSILFSSYVQLSEFEKKENYKNLFKKFSQYNPNVLGIQVYSYNIKPKKKNKETILSLYYEYGFIETGHDINAVIQHEYTFSNQTVNAFKKNEETFFKYNINNYLKFYLDNLNTQRKINTDLKRQIYEEIKKRASTTVNTSSTNFSTEDGIIIDLSLSLLQSKEQEDDSKELSLFYYLCKDTFNFRRERNELAASICSYEFFKFSAHHKFIYNGKDPDKMNRNYLSMIVETEQNQKYLFLILLSCDNVEEQNIDSFFADIKSSFETFLKNHNIIKI